MKLKEGLENKPSILIFGMDSYQKRNLHSEAKKSGFIPVYSMKNPSIKIVLQRSSSRKIETEKFKTTTIDVEHFWYMCRHLL